MKLNKRLLPHYQKFFKNTNYSLTKTLKVLLKSEHFFDESNFYSMIKSPYDYVFGIHKELDSFNFKIRNYKQEENGNFSAPDRLTNPETRKWYIGSIMKWPLNNQGMLIGDPPSVSGWPPFYQAPVYDLFWINSVTLLDKSSFAERIFKYGLHMGDDYTLLADKSDYLFTYQNNEDIDQLLNEMSERLLSRPISEQDKTRIISNSINGADKSHWTDLVRSFKAFDEENKGPIEKIFENICLKFLHLGNTIYFKMKRRDFLHNLAHVASVPMIYSSLGLTNLELQDLLYNSGSTKKLILIKLDGGNDGLNTLIPMSKLSELSNARPHVILPENKIINLGYKRFRTSPGV